MSNRRVVFVVGSGRSGTSAMSGTLRTLGLHVPQPEVVADHTNPKGFGEPRWVVDLHEELLRRSNVAVSDARPRASLDAATIGNVPATRERVATWLEGHFAGEAGPVDELVVKDPRTSWFLGLWQASAERCGATSSFVTMLRPVTEVVGSKQKYYGRTGALGSEQGVVTRTAGWVNMMLHTERATRGQQRRFVRFEDLLSDWTQPVFEIGEAFDLNKVKTAMAHHIAEVHSFIDPDLRRVAITWDDVQVPARLRELADETWQALDTIVDPARDDAAAHETFDQLREAYAAFYSDAEAVASSSIVAARRDATRRAQQADQQGDQQGDQRAGGRPGPRQGPPPGGPTRVADRVPHRVRAMVPPVARQKLRKALGRER